MKSIKEELVKLREDYLPYEKAVKVQKALVDIYKKEYKPKHSKAIYFDLIKKYKVSEINQRHEQTANWVEYVWECFSIVSQHIYGYTPEHCLDQIYDCVQNKKIRIKRYKTLPTLEQLVNSDTSIDPEKIYETKEIGTTEDECDGHSGDIILEMRKIGIWEYRHKNMGEMTKQFYSDFFFGKNTKE